MRYTRVGLASYVVALLLIGIAAGFALVRRAREGRAVVERPDTVVPGWRSLGQESYRSECALCHRDPGAFAPILRSEGGREYLIDLILHGHVRRVEDGRTTIEPIHPTFEHLSDERAAAICNHIAIGGLLERPFPEGIQPVAPSGVAARRDRGR
jgi:mono/diheme cytochrome c family protein